MDRPRSSDPTQAAGAPVRRAHQDVADFIFRSSRSITRGVMRLASGEDRDAQIGLDLGRQLGPLGEVVAAFQSLRQNADENMRLCPSAVMMPDRSQESHEDLNVPTIVSNIRFQNLAAVHPGFRLIAS